MEIEVRDAAAVIGAVIGVCTLTVAALNYRLSRRRDRDEREKAAAEKARRWSIRRRGPLRADGYTLLLLRVRVLDTQQMKLVEMKSLAPRGLVLACEQESKPGLQPHYAGTILDPDEATAGRAIRLGETLTSTTEFAEVVFYLKMPRRPWFRRSQAARASIEAKVEDISASNDRSTIVVQTEAMTWQSTTNAKAT